MEDIKFDIVNKVNLDNNFNSKKNIVRIEFQGLHYDVQLVGGVDEIPHDLTHGLLWVHHEDVVPIKDLSKDVGRDTEFKRGRISFGFLLNKFDDHKSHASTGTLNKLHIDGDTTYGDKALAIEVGGEGYGIFINRNGNVIVKGKGGSIELGEKGVVINGELIQKNMKNEKDTLLTRKKRLSMIPNNVATSPKNLNQMPDFEFLESFCKKIRSLIGLG